MTRCCPVKFATRCLLLLIFCTFPFAFAAAQSFAATLGGKVADQNGDAIHGVTVTIVNKATQLTREATTNGEGYFTVALLPPGAYTLRAQGQGFAPAEFTNLVLNVGDQKALQIQLKAGDINATVQVVNDAPLINESPAVGTVVDRQFVERLPLNGGSFNTLLQLTPGVLITPSSTNQAGQFTVNGQRGTANQFQVDGVSANFGVTPGF